MNDDLEPTVLEESLKPCNIRYRCFYFAKEVILFCKGVQV